MPAFPHLSSHKHFPFRAAHGGTGKEAVRHMGQIEIVQGGDKNKTWDVSEWPSNI